MSIYPIYSNSAMDMRTSQITISNYHISLMIQPQSTAINPYPICFTFPSSCPRFYQPVCSCCVCLCVCAPLWSLRIASRAQDTKSGALKKTSRYRSRSLSASSTDSFSSGEWFLV